MKPTHPRPLLSNENPLQGEAHAPQLDRGPTRRDEGKACMPVKTPLGVNK